ncbi:ubiquinone anaerobic biosynthesis accessory factor UbiT [Parachitinimonas caeni]|uniref:Ubiquinone biosynthesis accessory factor UbiT n=1 Tax=Parachitinimonas caeni TaxID=3031301 RepID=A0ABT7E6Y0_9NEIS|nr:SCP2 sterol-binding domain-containing protein [Parachitinimonas caeni]MDK2126672.1 SCP2 sterol-binding domain-containing protein [Parachitinimonas caeni]
MTILDLRIPPVLARLGSRLPPPLATLPLLAGLDLARRRHWLEAPAALDGKRFRLIVEDLGIDARFWCDKGYFKPVFSAKPVDLTLAAQAADFARLALGIEDADTLFFRRRMKIEGNTELGVAVKYWLDASERPPWLQALAKQF